MSDKTIKTEMVISLRSFKDDETGGYGVEMLISGLADEQQVTNAMDYIQGLLCGEEHKLN